MTQTKVLVVLAGAAAGLASSALANTGTTTDTTRAYAAELAADAANRSSEVQSSEGFIISDGANKLRFGGGTQFRYVMNFRDDEVGDDNDFTHGFQNRRTSLWVEGSVVDPNLSFRVRGEWSDVGNSGSDSSFNLLDAFGQYKFDNGFVVKFGQMLVPLTRDTGFVSDFGILGNERSIAEEAFNGGRTQGLALGYEGEQFRVIGAFTDGGRTANTDFTNPVEADYSLTGRLDYKTADTWGRFDDQTSFRGQDLAMLFGGGIHYQSSGDTGIQTGSNPTVDLLIYTIDATIEGNGWNVFAAFYGNNVDIDTPGSSSTDNFGFQLQGGVFLTNQVEIFARYDTLFLDKAPAFNNDEQDFHFLTAGVNYYLAEQSQAAKFTFDVYWSLNETSGGPDRDLASGQSQVGIFPVLPNTGGTLLGNPSDGEWGVRAGAQIVW